MLSMSARGFGENEGEARNVALSLRLTAEEDAILTDHARKTFRKKPDVVRLALARFFEAERAEAVEVEGGGR